MKITIAGGTGFLGKEITQYFVIQGDEIIIFTRGKSRVEGKLKYVKWDAKTLGDWTSELEDTDVLINLTGKSVDCKYTEQNKMEILSSRVDASRVLGIALQEIKNPPQLWLNASTATIYKHSLKQPMDEYNGEIGNDFSMSVAQDWEKAFYESNTPKTRKIALRISLVLGRNGGVFPVMKKLVKFGLGGRQGSGKQKFAWIHIHDLLRIIDFSISNDELSGPINCASPDDISNADFMKALQVGMKVPFGLPSPKFMLKIGAFFLRTEPELVLKSRFVMPKKLMDNGFVFNYEEVGDAMMQLLSNQK